MSAPSPMRVYKLGGSLLNLPDLRERLERLWSSDSRPVVLVGGGELADVVRNWQRTFSLTDDIAHDLAMRTLDVTAQLLIRLVGNARTCDSPEAVASAHREGAVAVVSPGIWFAATPGWFIGRPRLPTGLLPESWAVTSDTLAACVAIDLAAEELVLLKSVDWPNSGTLEGAAAEEFVDCEFPGIASRLPRITWCNLRTGQASNRLVRPASANGPP